MLSHSHHVQLFETQWMAAHPAPLSMGFPRQEYWSGLPLPSPGDLPDPGVKTTLLKSPALAGMFFITHATWEDLQLLFIHLKFSGLGVDCYHVPSTLG